MKIIVTGSLGHISKLLTEELVGKGHSVTVVSSKAERQKDIEALGAKAAIGTMADADFLAMSFAGADAVYCMLSTGGSYSDQNLDPMAYASKVANNYKHAIRQSGVKRVVNLSSIGAHTNKGNGLLAFYYDVENILNTLPSDVGITFMRPVGFYQNLLGFINAIKTQGVIASNYGGDDKKPWVSPIDIAAAVAQEITTPFVGRKVRYVASEEITCNEIASILGAAIGKPDLKWIVIPDEQLLKGMIAAGMNPRVAAGLVEMNASSHTGKLYEDYHRNRPVLGKVKMKDYAKEFARVYNQK
ncbi:MAG TPA: NAD(P)H-binding protein [Anaerolineales bacterium]|nr:NAD(P)H-binding protein [Anaerolineales bacterium]